MNVKHKTKDCFIDKIQICRTDKLFCDLFLELDDGITVKNISVHKLILYSNSPYFEKMLTNFRESSVDKIPIKVINVEVACDIINGFYGEIRNIHVNDWKYQLDLWKCRDFFGLEFVSVNNFKIPNQYFDQLVDTIDVIGYNNDTIRMVADNLPENYDLTKFPLELLQELHSYIYEYNIINNMPNYSCNLFNDIPNSCYQLVNPISGQIFLEFECNGSFGKVLFDYCYQKNLLLFMENYFLKIYNLDNGELKINISISRQYRCVKIIPGKNMFAFADIENTLNIYDIDKRKIINTSGKFYRPINDIECSPDGKYVVITFSENSMIYDTDHFELKTLFYVGHDIKKVKFTSDSEQLLIYGLHNVRICAISDLPYIKINAKTKVNIAEDINCDFTKINIVENINCVSIIDNRTIIVGTKNSLRKYDKNGKNCVVLNNNIHVKKIEVLFNGNIAVSNKENTCIYDSDLENIIVKNIANSYSSIIKAKCHNLAVKIRDTIKQKNSN
ncbi:BTB/POZ domain and WD-repeat protein [Cotonvirus japonicus]|uniref:BTB/POZ domain and WD-repeat protein n=1 Tax=Cotonvirus japonicus TaxID=2811091 RepID=A0ABM7NRD5_9VIRU|nr:BTB/POZ domain and WD-repeat protein [Cotonvirus japonicus]BCS82721.1 BTB/POZ domain and WD-repeat protein [Cotonvirus japonicus]